ncbi:MAG: hypothetical protein O3B64_03715 [bacterium]|nr:hypothetical protein [bacterium]
MRIKNLPEIQQFLLNTKVYDHLEDLVKEYNLPEERLEELLDLTDAVIDGRIDVNIMPEFLKKAFALKKEDADGLACDLAGFRLLPLADFLPGVELAIQNWGCELHKYPDGRVSGAEAYARIALQQFREEEGLQLPPQLEKRFELLALKYLTKERAKEATTVLLKRPITIGGLEFTNEMVNDLFQKLDAIGSQIEGLQKMKTKTVQKERVKFVDAPPGPPRPQNVNPLPASKAKQINVKKQNDFKAPKSQPRYVDAPPPPPKVRYVDAPPLPPGAIVRREPLTNQQYAKRMQGSMRAIIQIPTQELATEVPVTVGDYLKEDADEMEVHAKKAERYGGGAARNARSKELEQFAHTLCDKYSVQTVKRAQVSSLIVSVLRGIRSFAKADDILASYDVLTKDKRRALLSDVNAELAKATESGFSMNVVVQNKPRITQGASREERAMPPKKASVRISRPSTPAEGLHIDRVQDVVPNSRLIGPIDELGSIDARVFRRLSSNPKEAAERVLDKVESLKEERYADMVQGVKAWRKSPLSRLYVDMTRESLVSGVSITEIASKRRNNGTASLSPSEVAAIVMINQRLTY